MFRFNWLQVLFYTCLAQHLDRLVCYDDLSNAAGELLHDPSGATAGIQQAPVCRQSREHD